MYVSREQLVLTGVEDAGVDVVAAAEEEADEGGADEAAGAGDQHRLPRHLSRPFPELTSWLGWVSSHSECAATVGVPDCLSGYLTLGFFCGCVFSTSFGHLFWIIHNSHSDCAP